MKQPRVYISGPLATSDLHQHWMRLRSAVLLGNLLSAAGATPIFPHLMSIHVREDDPELDGWHRAGRRQLLSCDACLMLTGVGPSAQQVDDIEACRFVKMPVFFFEEGKDDDRLPEELRAWLAPAQPQQEGVLSSATSQVRRLGAVKLRRLYHSARTS